MGAVSHPPLAPSPCGPAMPVTGVAAITRNDRNGNDAPQGTAGWAESEWMPASSVRNWCLDDPILDWLNAHGRANGFVPDTEAEGYDPRCDMGLFVQKKGREFEQRITELLADRVAGLALTASVGAAAGGPSSISRDAGATEDAGHLIDPYSLFGDTLGAGSDLTPLITIGTGAEDSRDLKYAMATFEAMRKGAPLIAQAILRNPQDQTYGAVDLLVRSDVLHALFPGDLSYAEAMIPAPELKRPAFAGDGDAPWHYRAVEIKFKTLDLLVDGRASTDMLPQMAQVHIYNRALGRIQGYLPNASFLLGRSWRQGNGPGGNGAFERLARVDDDRIIADRGPLADIVAAALDWRRRLKHFGARWQALPTPSVPELAPHMRSSDDAPWHGAKAKIAAVTADLTMLPGMTPRRRAEALALGISRWDQEGISGAALGVAPRYAGQTDAVLRANRPLPGDLGGSTAPLAGKALLTALTGALDMADLAMATMVPEAAFAPQVAAGGTLSGATAVYPARIGLGGWRVPAPAEFIVDFESVSNINDDFAALPAIGGQAMIFQIGCGWLEDGTRPGTKKGDWGFRQFTTDRLTLAEEERIISEFMTFLEDELARRGVGWDQARLIHYSPAEVSLMDGRFHGARGRHPGASWPEQLPWWDFLTRVVRAEPVAVRGAFGFGLKPVAKSMATAGLVDVAWKDGPTDGLGATIAAFRADEEAKRAGISMRETDLMKGVSSYNEIDCFSLACVLNWCRTHR